MLDVHEHRADHPMVERGREWSVQEEVGTRAEASVREEGDGTDIKHDTATKRENDQFNKNERSDLHTKRVNYQM